MSRLNSMGPKDRIRRIRILHTAQGGVCAICWNPMVHPDDARSERRHGSRSILPHHPTIEHVKPRSHHGTNALGNLLATHHSCNVARGCRPLPEKALVMHERVLGWLELQYGHVPQRHPEHMR